jgi:ribosomal protein L11 methyltransferase
MTLGKRDPLAVEQALLDAGAVSVTLSDAADTPVLEPGVGETPLWPDTRITALYEAGTDEKQLRAFLADSLGDVEDGVLEPLADRDWEREWLKSFRPMRFGERLWVCPGGMRPEDGDEAVVVELDPGLAFGTGTHATTAMCLEWLESLDLRGSRVLDYGCGSGVLAIAAMRLDAAHATGIDNDPQAIIATAANAMNNGVDVSVCEDPAELDGPYDVVVANILAGPLVDLATQLSEYVKKGGRLALSGILEEQSASIRNAYEPTIAFDDVTSRLQDGQRWIRLAGIKSAE